MDKMRLTDVVRRELGRSFSGDVCNGTTTEKLQFVISELTVLSKVRTVSPHYSCHTAAIISLISEIGLHRGLQECWDSAGSWCTSISATIRSDHLEQRVLPECWGSAQRVLPECWGSDQAKVLTFAVSADNHLETP